MGCLGDDCLRAVEDQTGGQREVVLAEGGGNLEEGDSSRRQLVDVRDDPDAPFHLPGQHDLHDAFDLGDCRQDAGLNDALDLGNVPVRDDAELYDGDLIGVKAANGGLFHSRGESDVVHGGGDSALRFRHVRTVLEGSEDGGVALERCRLCRFQTRSIGNGPLYRSGDVLDDGLRVCRGVGCEYGNEGELDLGEQLDLKRAVGEYA